ncbi:wax ester/triacylglycerol synthase family O-acyltransferase [Spongiibacter taiwanensis]|uniref:wax ester/triacylglycerol synthase family O-acyltransferase n=1 Tax=Spongiibacter taiwanensis TaxID=1748242 RepID=UPI00203642B8|nr:wax ester/triacylglycerol synthase family O-acyltransferase [Spongiibacter taiwanensis]USA42203.1 wax ester/triacylglycerol synthase family O-acyltransferase [Spongiibacter taiwanensis]
MEQLQAQDAQFLYMQTARNPSHVTLAIHLDGSDKDPLAYQDIVEHFKSRFRLLPFYGKKIKRLPAELDFPYWVEDAEFLPEYHFDQASLPAPGDWSELRRAIAQLHAAPMDMSRPIWDVTVLTDVNCNGPVGKGVSVICRVHHAAVDGAALMQLIGLLTDIDADGTPAVGELPPQVAVDTGRKGIWQLGRTALVNRWRAPLQLTKSISQESKSIVAAIKDRWQGGNTLPTVPPSRFNRRVSENKVFDAIDFPIALLSQIRRKVEGATLNDVVLAVCAGALRRYLESHEDLPVLPLSAWIPVNARSAGGENQSRGGNNISAMSVPIYTDTHEPLKRLAAIHEATQMAKRGELGLSSRLMTSVMKHLPATEQYLMSKLIVTSGVVAKSCNLFVSNVPGPTQPLYLCGHPIVNVNGMTPLADGMGLFIATPSYNGKLSFNIITTEEIMPDIEDFKACLAAAVDELLEA